MIVACPHCHFNYLHQEKIEVFDRGEDSDKGDYVSIGGKDGSVLSVNSPLPPGNPSGRRHGLTIHFWCEGCEELPQLNIYQHKGQTFMEWKGLSRNLMLLERDA